MSKENLAFQCKIKKDDKATEPNDHNTCVKTLRNELNIDHDADLIEGKGNSLEVIRYWDGGLPSTLYSFCNRVEFSSGAIIDSTLW